MACEWDKVFLKNFFYKDNGRAIGGCGKYRCERRGGQSAASCLSMYEISRVYTDTELDSTKGSARGAVIYEVCSILSHKQTSLTPAHVILPSAIDIIRTRMVGSIRPLLFSPTMSPTSRVCVCVRVCDDARDRFHVICFANGCCRGGNDDKDDNGDGRRGITPNPRRQHTTSGPIV